MNHDSETQPQDTSPLYSTLADDPDMRELVELFVHDLSERVTLIVQCSEDQDLEQLRTIAHQLKGSAAGYGFQPIGEAAQELERTLKLGVPPYDPQTVRQQTNDLLHVCQRAMKSAA